LVSSQ